MTISEQTSILLEAAEHDFLQPEDIVRWADAVIVAMEKPPGWVIELSTLSSSHLVDFVSSLRAEAPSALSMHRRIQIVVLAHSTGMVSLINLLPKLFHIMIHEEVLEGKKLQRDALDEQLRDTLVEWDCQEDLDVIELPLRVKFEALFQEYLADAHDVAAVLSWKTAAMKT